MEFSDLKKIGSVVLYQDQPHEVIWSSFVRKQQRQPVIQTKLRNLINGKVLEYSFKPSEPIKGAEIVKQEAQYLYTDDTGSHFMNNENFETIDIQKELTAGKIDYIKEGSNIILKYYDEKPIGVDLPIKVDLKVIETPPGIKGNTSSGGNKPATLETGLTVQVPLFIKEGDTVRVNTESGEYTERVS